MSNPLFGMLGGNAQQNNPIMQFPKFMQQMRGKDPNAMINELVASGKINQQQLNQAQQMAKQMEGPLGALKGMFGFN